MHRPRVGLVIGQLDRGGAEKQLVILAEGLKRDHGMEPVVYCLSSIVEPYGSVLKREGIRLRALAAGGIAGLLRPWELRRLLRSDRIDLVQAFLLSATVHGALATLGTDRVPFVASYRNVDQLRPAVRRKVESWAFGRARIVTVNSRDGLRFAEDYYGVAASKLRFIPNAVDTTAGPTRSRAEARRRLGLTQEVPVLLGVFRVTEQKNPDLFCRVVEETLSDSADGVCLIAGEGPLLGWLEQRARSSPREGMIRVLGPRDDVPTLLAAADLLLLTSRYEGMPNVVMEAMAAGLPVVSTAVGDVPVLVEDRRTGFLLDADDGPGLVRSCRALIGDPDLRVSMGEQARSRARSEYGIGRMVGSYADLYRELMSSGQPPAPGSARTVPS